MVYGTDRQALLRPGVLTSLQGLGEMIYQNVTASPISVTFGTNDLGFFAKVWNPRAFTATHGWYFIGTVASGNIDIGVYVPNGASGDIALINSTGATAASGADANGSVQVVAFATPFIVPAGEIVLGVSASASAQTIMTCPISEWTNSARQLAALGEKVSSHPLPASVSSIVQATPSNGPPIFGVSNRLY